MRVGGLCVYIGGRKKEGGVELEIVSRLGSQGVEEARLRQVVKINFQF